MHLVLDGEATPAEAGELEKRLAADAAARARYDELRSMFAALSRVPKVYPPEGLIASVLANIPQNPDERSVDDQLFMPPGVFGASSSKARGKPPERSSRLRQVFQPWPFSRGQDMNEQKRRFSPNRKIVIAGGVAVAAAVVIAATGLFPPNSSQTAGTIAPAQRYQATPISAGDIKLGTQGGGGATGIATGNPGVANAGAANAGAGNLGSGNLGAGNLGAGNLGSGNLGSGNLGSGNLGAGENKGSGNLGSGNLGSGNLGSGNLGSGNLGAGNLGSGNLGSGNLGSGNLGAGTNQGSGNLGSGNLGSGNLGAGNLGSG
ncbi:MAG TPA: hypothetical protein VJ891_14140, partial [Casimicrobiaceae bacterium]|nr:hypothetical protein [Casimicrobiaceae bacterium]